MKRLGDSIKVLVNLMLSRGKYAVQNSKSTLVSILLAFRPKTLTAALVPCLVGSVLAWSEHGVFVWWILACALLSAFCIQIATNLVNDAVDFEKGADNEERIGPQRITQSGVLSAKQVLMLASLFFGLAFLFGIPLVSVGGWPIVGIGLISLLMAYAYTGGPYPLAYHGLGDLFVIIFFGWVAVGGIYYLQSGTYSISAFVLGTQIGFLAAVLIAINNFRDYLTDQEVDKRTLAVRWGPTWARFEIAFLSYAPFVIGIYWFSTEIEMATALPLFIFWIAEKIVKGVSKNDPNPLYNKFLGWSAALHLLFGITWSIGALLK